MRLPPDLKLMILKLLPATDVTRMACVSSKVQSLCSNNEIWKQWYLEEFGRAFETENLQLEKQT